MRLKLLIILFFSLSIFAQASDKEKIEYLLKSIKESNHTFIRNGDEHTSEEAYKHLSFKLNYVKKAFFFFGPEKNIPVKDFIEKIASKSSSTDKPYYIKGKNLKKTPVKKWLYMKLDEYNKLNKLQKVAKPELVSEEDQKLKQ